MKLYKQVKNMLHLLISRKPIEHIWLAILSHTCVPSFISSPKHSRVIPFPLLFSPLIPTSIISNYANALKYPVPSYRSNPLPDSNTSHRSSASTATTQCTTISRPASTRCSPSPAYTTESRCRSRRRHCDCRRPRRFLHQLRSSQESSR